MNYVLVTLSTSKYLSFQPKGETYFNSHFQKFQSIAGRCKWIKDKVEGSNAHKSCWNHGGTRKQTKKGWAIEGFLSTAFSVAPEVTGIFWLDPCSPPHVNYTVPIISTVHDALGGLPCTLGMSFTGAAFAYHVWAFGFNSQCHNLIKKTEKFQQSLREKGWKWHFI